MENRMTTNNQALGRQFFDALVRPEIIIHLGTMCWGEDFGSDAEYVFLENWDKACDALGINREDYFEHREEFAWLANHLAEEHKHGFLVQVGTPEVRLDSDGSVLPGSFHGYMTTWIYGADMLEVLEKAITWRKDYISRERKKLKTTAMAESWHGEKRCISGH
jgi:hypothetical protein